MSAQIIQMMAILRSWLSGHIGYPPRTTLRPWMTGRGEHMMATLRD